MAVLSVIAFHAFPHWLKGGFIGVDVFFVISGFLISTIIFESLGRGTFSFSEFYARRIKRIFPALLIVLIACLAGGRFALLADEYKQLGKHIAAGAGFVSNLVLWSEAGYFDNSADTKPLLHLWSLGIEEQFYILWPLLLWLTWKRKLNFLTTTILVAIACFALNVTEVTHNAVAAFYSPQTRFWELMSGSLLAWLGLYKKNAYSGFTARLHDWRGAASGEPPSRHDESRLANALSLLGLLLLACGFLCIDERSRFPGVWAMVPVLGAVALISAGPNAWLNSKILSNPAAVWIGLISFPLYLWHWPLLSFAWILESGAPSRSIRIAAVVLSFLLAWLTYRLIERRIRLGGHSRVKVASLIVLMTAVGYLGYYTYSRDGLELGLEDGAPRDHERELALALADAAERCNQLFPEWTSVTDNACRLQRARGQNTIALVGDSYAGHLFSGLTELVDPNDGVAVFAASCAAPFLDVATATREKDARKVREGAYRLIDHAYDYIIKSPRIKIVVLSHNPQCSYGGAIDMENPGIGDFRIALENSMRRTFEKLIKANKKVIVLLDHPFLPFEPRSCVNRPFRLTKKSGHCSFPREKFDHLPASTQYRDLVRRVLKDYPQVMSYDLSGLFCDDERCYPSRDGRLLYRDRGHLNEDGSRYVAPYLLRAIDALR